MSKEEQYYISVPINYDETTIKVNGKKVTPAKNVKSYAVYKGQDDFKDFKNL